MIGLEQIEKNVFIYNYCVCFTFPLLIFFYRRVQNFNTQKTEVETKSTICCCIVAAISIAKLNRETVSDCGIILMDYYNLYVQHSWQL